MKKLYKFLFVLVVLSCDDEITVVPVSAQARPYYDKDKICAYCGSWNINEPFPSSSISSGTYRIELTKSNEYAYPWDDGFIVTVWNTGSTPVTIIVSGTYNGNGIHELKPGDGVTFAELFFYDFLPNEKVFECYTSTSPYMDAVMKILTSTGTASISVSVGHGQKSCASIPEGGKRWDLIVN